MLGNLCAWDAVVANLDRDDTGAKNILKIFLNQNDLQIPIRVGPNLPIIVYNFVMADMIYSEPLEKIINILEKLSESRPSYRQPLYFKEIRCALSCLNKLLSAEKIEPEEIKEAASQVYSESECREWIKKLEDDASESIAGLLGEASESTDAV